MGYNLLANTLQGVYKDLVMDKIFALLVLFGVLALTIGLLKPSIVIRWKKEATRKDVLKAYISLIFISIIGIGIFAPPTPNNRTKSVIQEKEKSINTIQKEKVIKFITKKEEKKKLSPTISTPPIYIIMEDIILDEDKNKELKAIAVIWKDPKEEVTLLLKKDNFKKGYSYTGSHDKDEYYKKYLPNIRIHAKINNIIYDYTPTIKKCNLKMEIIDINEKEKIAKFSIDATLATKDKNGSLQFKKLSNVIYTIAGKDFIELETLLKQFVTNKLEACKDIIQLPSFKYLTGVKNRKLLDSVISKYCAIGMCSYNTIKMMYNNELKASKEKLSW